MNALKVVGLVLGFLGVGMLILMKLLILLVTGVFLTMLEKERPHLDDSSTKAAHRLDKALSARH